MLNGNPTPPLKKKTDFRIQQQNPAALKTLQRCSMKLTSTHHLCLNLGCRQGLSPSTTLIHIYMLKHKN